MAYTQAWSVTDNSGTAHETVGAFFATGNDALVKQHLDIEIGLVFDKVNSLSEDKKSFLHQKTFKNEEGYNTWLAEKAKLPVIDDHLTYTLI